MTREEALRAIVDAFAGLALETATDSHGTERSKKQCAEVLAALGVPAKEVKRYLAAF